MSTPAINLPSVANVIHDEDRVSLTKDALKHGFLDNLFYIQGKFPALATNAGSPPRRRTPSRARVRSRIYRPNS